MTVLAAMGEREARRVRESRRGAVNDFGDEGRLHAYLDGPTVTRRQDKPRVFARNGPAVLAVRAGVLAGGSLYGEDVRALVMSAADSVDIDSAADVEYAAYLLARVKA